MRSPLALATCLALSGCIGWSDVPAELDDWEPAPLTDEPVAFGFVHRELGTWALTDEPEQAQRVEATAERLFSQLELANREDILRPLDTWRTLRDAPVRVRLTLSAPSLGNDPSSAFFALFLPVPFFCRVTARAEVFAYGELVYDETSATSGGLVIWLPLGFLVISPWEFWAPVDASAQLALWRLSQHPGWARRWKAPVSARAACAGQRDPSDPYCPCCKVR